MKETLHIALIEPYYTGSHARWAKDLINDSRHSIQLFSLPGRYWKWRMEGAAITLAHQINDSDDVYDILLCSDMMDLTLFKSLLHPRFANTPIVYYLHENQFNYPRSPDDRDYGRPEVHYGFINYKSCLVADYCVFNSDWHRRHFLNALTQLFQRLPDFQPLDTIKEIQAKSSILPIPMPIEKIKSIPKIPDISSDVPVLLWNHRWEFDKQPEVFVKLCNNLDDLSKSFKINFLGQHNKSTTPTIEAFKKRHSNRILHFGYVHNYVKYIQILKASDILPVTAIHDFFGISVMEAVACGVTPILPGGMVYSDHFEGLTTRNYHHNYEQLLDHTLYHLDAFETDQSITPSVFNLNRYDIESVIGVYDAYFECIKKERQYD